MKLFFPRRCAAILLAAVVATRVPGAQVTVSFDKDGRNTGAIPALSPGDSILFDLPKDAAFTVSYKFSNQIGNGYRLDCDGPLPYSPGSPIRIPQNRSAFYFNIDGPAKPDPADVTQLSELTAKHEYYADLQTSLSWTAKQTIQDRIADMNSEINQLQEEIKAYTGISLADAVQAIERRQAGIRNLRAEIKGLQKQLDGSSLADQVKQIDDQIKQLNNKITADDTAVLIRAGVLPIGEHRKTAFYTIANSGDPSNPYLLKHFQAFPVFTTDDTPYLVILAQQDGTDPQGLHASFTSMAGSYIDVDPVRPVVTQGSAPSQAAGGNFLIPKTHTRLGVCIQQQLESALVDRVLTFANQLAGETAYSVTVTGYGLATSTDQITTTTGDTPSMQHQVVTSQADVKVLDGEVWPQVHSLFRYNISTGVLWTTIRTPSFSRVPTGAFLQGCDPTTSTTACTPIYQTIKDSGGPRVLPALMFSIYAWGKRDTQVPVQWKELLPVPTFGVSLTSPTDDFFLGGSSELKGLRNVQLVYGLHLGRVSKLGANSFQLSTDSAGPTTTTSLQKGAYTGLTFNIDFVKALFGK